MVIANPIYDVVFKRMMENERVAKFFIGTLLEETIETVEVKSQEFTYIKELNHDDPDVKKFIKESIYQQLNINLFRLDFLATIKTKTGELKKVLIEIQKAKKQVDLMRFRNYLGEHYKKMDELGNVKQVLPITTIYILGFNLPEIKSACIKVERNYKDLIEQKIIIGKSDFVEKLTHDSFIVQVNRITNKFQTSLDKLLSIFEQRNFLDEYKIIKDYQHKIDNEDLKIATEILHHAGVDPAQKKLIEIEQEAWRSINAMFEEKERNFLKEIDENRKSMGEKDKALDENRKSMDEKDKIIEELIKKLKLK